jgi:hypothetical protein
MSIQQFMILGRLAHPKIVPLTPSDLRVRHRIPIGIHDPSPDRHRAIQPHDVILRDRIPTVGAPIQARVRETVKPKAIWPGRVARIHDATDTQRSATNGSSINKSDGCESPDRSREADNERAGPAHRLP